MHDVDRHKMTPDASDATVPSGERPPLCVDLDGTLVRTDTLLEGLIALMGGMRFAALAGGLVRGPSGLKAQAAGLAPTDPALLPYNGPMLDYIRAERATGRRIILTTAANETVARSVAAWLGLFDEVIASTPTHNLKGRAKAEALTGRFGPEGFVYAGDAGADLPVWRQAAAAVLVNVRPSVAAKARAHTAVEYVIDDQPGIAGALFRAMRPRHWVRNLLVFVPIFTAAAIGDEASWGGGVLAFLAFCATVSSLYMVDDLLDLAADRAHPRKRHRPFAAGTAPLPAGIAVSALLLLFGLGLAWMGGILFVMLAYAVASLAWSMWLKRQPLIDVFVLAGFYTARLIAGGQATGHPLSLRLLAFASFLFLGMALVKRVAEVMSSAERASDADPRRVYGPGDLVILELFGVCATFASSLVLTFYVRYEASMDRFASPDLLWGVVPLMLLWNCRMWLATTRGQMRQDPVGYAARDWVSWSVAGGVVLLVLAARAGVVVPG